MLQSDHYELKLVEGSDIVNPLVIDRPNYEVIDGVMYNNESQAIGNATELKSGTIHAITRSKGNQRFFIFTATSNYDLGDTFTIDSVPVTALMPNGTALPDKAYVVNSTVLCSLVGTLLTVYTVGSALADDSLKLGGELPSYYATASDLNDTDTLARGASTLSLANEQAIRAINSSLPFKTPTALSAYSWSNSGDEYTTPKRGWYRLLLQGSSNQDVTIKSNDLTILFCHANHYVQTLVYLEVGVKLKVLFGTGSGANATIYQYDM